MFEDLGVRLRDLRLVVVKSTEHFRADFAALTSQIIRVDSGGALRFDFASMPYTKRSGCFFPRVADPLQTLTRESCAQYDAREPAKDGRLALKRAGACGLAAGFPRLRTRRFPRLGTTRFPEFRTT